MRSDISVSVHLVNMLCKAFIYVYLRSLSDKKDKYISEYV